MSRCANKFWQDLLKLAPLGVFLISLTFFSFHLGTRPIATRGEGREAIVVKGMFEQHNFVLPLRNGGEIPSKPPMFHWLAALTSVAVGGLSEFSVRFPSALSASLLLGALFAFTSFYRGSTAALYSVLVTATTFEFARSATHGRVDMCFTFGLCAALFSLYRNLELWIDEFDYSWFWLGCLALSTVFAVLAKGPAGLAIILIIAVVCMIAFAGDPPIDRLKQFPFLPFIIALTGSIILAGLWYWLAYVEHGWAFVSKHLWDENVTRFFNVAGATEHRGHLKPFYFSFIHLFLGFLPWSLLFPVLLRSVWKKRVNLKKAEGRLDFFLFVWVLTVLIAVTLSQSKRVVYLLPAYPAIGLLLGSALSRSKAHLKKDDASFKVAAVQLGALAFVVVFVLCAAAALLASSSIVMAEVSDIPAELENYLRLGQEYARQYAGFLISLIAAAVLMLSSVKSFWRLCGRQGALSLALSMLIIVYSVGQWIYPAIAEANDPRPIMAQVKGLLSKKNEQVASYRLKLYAERFYIDRDIVLLKNPKEVEMHGGGYLVTQEQMLPELMSSEPNALVVSHSKENLLNSKKRLVLLRYGL